MHLKYLLYFDVLDFSDMVDNDPSRVPDIYQVIDSLNVHRHEGFRTIVFSDTIITYNSAELHSPDDHRHAVMFSCEFVQDLLFRLAGSAIFFRALLIYGDFSHYELEHIQCFYGTALIEAYLREKAIPATGLFIAEPCVSHNHVFPTHKFAPDQYFVFLCQSLENLQADSHGSLPVESFLVTDADNYPFIVHELRYLADVFNTSRSHPDPKVRTKHAATYDLYRQRYPRLLSIFEDSGFSPAPILPSFDWSSRE